jgi:hypothetical protein
VQTKGVSFKSREAFAVSLRKKKKEKILTEKRIKLYDSHEMRKRKNEKWKYRDANHIFADLIQIREGITFFWTENTDFNPPYNFHKLLSERGGSSLFESNPHQPLNSSIVIIL